MPKIKGLCVCVCFSHSAVSDSVWPMDCSLPGSSIHGIFHSHGILEWMALFFSRGSSQPRDWTWISSTAGRLYHLSRQGTREETEGNLREWISSPMLEAEPRKIVARNKDNLCEMFGTEYYRWLINSSTNSSMWGLLDTIWRLLWNVLWVPKNPP